MVEKYKTEIHDGFLIPDNDRSREHSVPAFVELSQNILKKSGSSSPSVLTIIEQTTLQKYAY